MAEKIVTLYLDDTSIRVLATSGLKIKKWADVPLEPGLIKNGVILKQDDVALKIRQLFKIRKLSSRNVVLGISGLHCFTRPLTLPELPRDMLEEAVAREAKRVLPVSPEQLYYSWQAVPAPDGKVQAFLVAVPRKMADALFNTLAKAGLKSALMDLKPMLLARLVKETMAIIVDVQPTEFDIVIMVGGIPQPVRTVRLPGEMASWKEKLALIQKEIGRTIEFYTANNPEIPLDPTLPIYVSGQLADEQDACRQLSRELKRPLVPLPSPLKDLNGLNPNSYLANMALVLKKLSSYNGGGLSVPAINVAPEIYRPKPFPISRVVAPSVAAVAAGLLGLMAMLVQGVSADVTAIENQLNVTNQLLQQRAVQQGALSGTIARLQDEITEAETSGGNFAAALESLQTESARLNSDLEVAVDSLSPVIQLTGVSHTGSALTLAGEAPGKQDILSYVARLEDSGRFSQVTITNMRQASEQRMDFNLLLAKGGGA